MHTQKHTHARWTLVPPWYSSSLEKEYLNTRCKFCKPHMLPVTIGTDCVAALKGSQRNDSNNGKSSTDLSLASPTNSPLCSFFVLLWHNSMWGNTHINLHYWHSHGDTIVLESKPNNIKTRMCANAQRDGRCEDMAQQSCSTVHRWQIFGNFLRPAFPASRVYHISDLHSKFALRPHHV